MRSLVFAMVAFAAPAAAAQDGSSSAVGVVVATAIIIAVVVIALTRGHGRGHAPRRRQSDRGGRDNVYLNTGGIDPGSHTASHGHAAPSWDNGLHSGVTGWGDGGSGGDGGGGHGGH